MRGGWLQRTARRLWAGELGWGGTAVSLVLAPLAGLWRLATWISNRRMDLRGGVAVDGLRVVSVGNLAVGGTGKTPITSWVARALAEQGEKPAIVLRGYGRDEVLLHREWTPDLPVVIGRDRIAAAEGARDAGADVAVLDDGFQHRRLDRALDLVLLAVEDPLRVRLLPRGPYREPITALRRATAVVLTRRSASVEQARAFAAELARGGRVPEGVVAACVHLGADGVYALADRRPVIAPAPLRGPLVVTAVGRPEAFRRDVEAMSEGAVELLDYEDHHEFTVEEARMARARAGDRPIVITEKDAVKLRSFSAALGEVLVVRQRISWDWGEDAIRALLRGVRIGAGR